MYCERPCRLAVVCGYSTCSSLLWCTWNSLYISCLGHSAPLDCRPPALHSVESTSKMLDKTSYLLAPYLGKWFFLSLLEPRSST